MIALGLIETKGLIAAIEAADAMLKAADVYLLERTCIGAGLVTITVASKDVGAVQASVDAAVAAISRVPGAIVVSKHVIPRPDLELHQILKLTPLALSNEINNANASTNDSLKKTVTPAKTVETTSKDTAVDATVIKNNDTEEPKNKELATQKRYTVAQLKAMKLSNLQEIARNTVNFPLGKDVIATTSRSVLIVELIKIFK